MIDIALTTSQDTKSQRSNPPTEVPVISVQIKFDLKEIGFSLDADEQTLKELDEIREDAVKAAQSIRKFAWR